MTPAPSISAQQGRPRQQARFACGRSSASLSSRWLAPVALLIALSRVTAGVDYLHDVLAGLALGTAVVASITIVMTNRPWWA